MKCRLPDILLAMMLLASALLILLTAASYVRTLIVTHHWAKPGTPTAEGTLLEQDRALAAGRGWLVWLWDGTKAVGTSPPLPPGPWEFNPRGLRSEISEYHWRIDAPGSPGWGEHRFLIFDYTNSGWLPATSPITQPAPKLRRANFRLRISLWAITLPTLAVTAWLWTLRRRRGRAFRRAHHLCESCGYDLRATPDRCPECGEAAMRPVPN